MMFIRKRVLPTGRVRYSVVFTDPQGRRREKTAGSTRKSAELLRSRLEKELASGEWGKEKREDPTLSQFYERWITSKEKSLKPSTLVSYKVAFRNHILPRLGKKRLSDIRPLDIQAFVDDLSSNGFSPATVGRLYRYLRACMRQAVAWEVIGESPFKGILLPRIPKDELVFLDDKEISRLLEEAREPEKALFAVLALAGLRLGEALALQWKDIDFDMRAIYVTKSFSYWGGIQEPKTEASRRAVPLLPTLAEILLDHKDFMGDPEPDAFLFQTRGLRPLDPANARKRFEETLKRAGLKRVTLHSLRHSYASIMLASGASIKALQHALGHSQVTMTLGTYGHLIEERMDEAVARMDALLRGTEEGKVVTIDRRRKRGV